MILRLLFVTARVAKKICLIILAARQMAAEAAVVAFDVINGNNLRTDCARKSTKTS